MPCGRSNPYREQEQPRGHHSAPGGRWGQPGSCIQRTSRGGAPPLIQLWNIARLCGAWPRLLREWTYPCSSLRATQPHLGREQPPTEPASKEGCRIPKQSVGEAFAKMPLGKRQCRETGGSVAPQGQRRSCLPEEMESNTRVAGLTAVEVKTH